MAIIFTTNLDKNQDNWESVLFAAMQLLSQKFHPVSYGVNNDALIEIIIENSEHELRHMKEIDSSSGKFIEEMNQSFAELSNLKITSVSRSSVSGAKLFSELLIEKINTLATEYNPEVKSSIKVALQRILKVHKIGIEQKLPTIVKQLKTLIQADEKKDPWDSHFADDPYSSMHDSDMGTSHELPMASPYNPAGFTPHFSADDDPFSHVPGMGGHSPNDFFSDEQKRIEKQNQALLKRLERDQRKTKRENEKQMLKIHLKKLKEKYREKVVVTTEVSLLELLNLVQEKRFENLLFSENIHLGIIVGNVSNPEEKFKSTIIHFDVDHKKLYRNITNLRRICFISVPISSTRFRNIDSEISSVLTRIDIDVLVEELKLAGLIRNNSMIYYSNNALSQLDGFLIKINGFTLPSEQIKLFQMDIQSILNQIGLDQFFTCHKIQAVNYKLNGQAKQLTRSSGNEKLSVPPDLDKILKYRTQRFFDKKELQKPKDWVAKDLDYGKYKGHKMRFYTFPKSKRTQANELCQHLSKNGFQAKVIETVKNNRPCVTVTLDEGSPKVPKVMK